jgi:hypothetical protein
MTTSAGDRDYSLSENGGTLEKAAAMANHPRPARRSSTIAGAMRSASMRSTAYPRLRVSPDEAERRIVI